jgi:hypothetical protein
VVTENLDVALREAGWEVDPQGLWASRDGVLVRFVAYTFAWSTHRIPVSSWWTADAPCPASTRLVERDVSGATEHACLGPGDVLDGPYARVWDGGGSYGWYARGEPDGDWLDLSPSSFAVRSYVRGVPAGSWESLSYAGPQSEGRYVDGAKDGTWTSTARGRGGELETEVVEWCRGVRCGAYRRTSRVWGETGSYRDDLRQGLWQTTYNGVVVSEGSYDQDRQDGVWLQYDSLGRVVRRDRYRHGVLLRSREWVEDEWGRLRGRRLAE